MAAAAAFAQQPRIVGDLLVVTVCSVPAGGAEDGDEVTVRRADITAVLKPKRLAERPCVQIKINEVLMFAYGSRSAFHWAMHEDPEAKGLAPP